MPKLDLQYPSDNEDMEGIRYPTPPPIEDGDPSLLESVSCVSQTVVYLTFLAVLHHVSEWTSATTASVQSVLSAWTTLTSWRKVALSAQPAGRNTGATTSHTRYVIAQHFKYYITELIV